MLFSCVTLAASIARPTTYVRRRRAQRRRGGDGIATARLVASVIKMTLYGRHADDASAVLIGAMYVLAR